jgi:hypothetical protein
VPPASGGDGLATGPHLSGACGFRHSIALAGRDIGRQARVGLYQCSNGTCRFQFTVTTRTPLHSTKLPLRIWLTGLWLILQSDKGISSVRLAEAIGVNQPTAWRMGHALRLLVTGEQQLGGMVEIDEFYIGGSLAETPIVPVWVAAARGSRGPRKQRFSPWSNDQSRFKTERQPEEQELGWLMIYRSVRPDGC